MKDKIQSFIEDHRKGLDHLEPRESTRDAVLGSLRPGWIVPILAWKIAAMVFFAATVYLSLRTVPVESNGQVVNGRNFNEIEQFYQAELTRREEWLQTSEGVSGNPELIQLQSMYDVLREQWVQSPTDRLEDAMTLNLIVRVKRMDELISLQSSRTSGL